MRLLILTQKVDKEDPILGFFHGWLLKLAERFEKVLVICLEKGSFELPENVRVYSLGKEQKYKSRIMNYELCRKMAYIFKFFNILIFQLPKYDAVFVHMNQEYVLLGGFIWKLLGKKIYFWRNHAKGNILTELAVKLSDRVFCTSAVAYVANSQKTQLMPVGIDTEKFKDFGTNRSKNSILSLGRISPIKNIHLIVEIAKVLKDKDVAFALDIVGDPANDKDVDYKKQLIADNQSLIKSGVVNFYPSVLNHQTPAIYNSHDIFINLTLRGSLDKTAFEAAACGCVPFSLYQEFPKLLTGSDPKLGIVLPDLDPGGNTLRLIGWFNAMEERKREIREQLKRYVLENHSLNALMDKLTLCIKGKQSV